MPQFNVLVTVDTTQSAVIPVDADDRESAIEKALEEARFNGFNHTWTDDDGGSWKPYIADYEFCVMDDGPTPEPTQVERATALLGELHGKLNPESELAETLASAIDELHRNKLVFEGKTE